MNSKTTASRRNCISNQRGISLIEAIVSLVIVSTMVVAAMQLFSGVSRIRQSQMRRPTGEILTQQLLTEIIQKAYQDPDNSIIFGNEQGEGNSRENFDDVDDYHQWEETPPLYPDGSEMEHLHKWTRKVLVNWVIPEDVNSISTTETNVKSIVVTVIDPSGRESTGYAIRANVDELWKKPPAETEFVTNVYVELQIGDNIEPLQSGAAAISQFAPWPED